MAIFSIFARINCTIFHTHLSSLSYSFCSAWQLLQRACWDGTNLYVISRDVNDNFWNGSFNPVTNTWTYMPNDNQLMADRCVWTGTSLLTFDSNRIQYFNQSGGPSKEFYFPTANAYYIMRKN